jgi:hypothetical protein
VSGPEIGPEIEAKIRNYVFQEPDILSSEIGTGDCSSFDPHLSVVGPHIVPEAVTHHGLPSSNSTKLDFVSTLHVDPDLDSLHIIFTDCFGNQTGASKQDEQHSIQKLDGIYRVLPIHADLEKRNMHFIFTDISGRLMTFHSFSRSMHTADCTIHTSHGSCYYIRIIFTGPCSFLNFNGAFCSSMIWLHH